MTESSLILQLQQGDQSAFRRIVEEWKDMVYNTALGILQNVEDAEDITQEVFIKVYESVDGFREDSKFSTWLYRITISKSLDQIRKKKRKKRFAFIQSLFGVSNELVHDPPDFDHPGVLLDRKADAAELFRCIKELPEKQQVAFVLQKLEGMDYNQISEVMETSLSSVESLLHRAKVNLRKNLEHVYHEA